MNFGVDNGFYPLGSCTMKYNPKVLEEIASWPTVTDLHPYQAPEHLQGSLELLYELERCLCVLGGMEAVTLQPAAGAHGEFTGIQLIRAFHASRGEDRTEIIVPDTAHGTNPASAAMGGYDLLELPSKEGRVDLAALRAAVSRRTAGMMLTNPNTLGIFERDVVDIARILHAAGALLYYDGANLNAIMGKTTPGAMGFDIVHFNLHKTFATPHGGGGPGAGPVGVLAPLEPFLPVPRIVRDGGSYRLDWDRPKSIGKVRSYLGNFAVLVRAYAYIRLMGGDGLTAATERAVLNANYLKEQLKDTFDVPFDGPRKHEFVLSAKNLRERGVRALDVAKRLLDFGIHAPTIYFPMIVEEALMIEPTETESRQTLDRFIAVLRQIAAEDPELLRSAPHHTAVGRVDEVRAVRDLRLSWMAAQKGAPLSEPHPSQAGA